MAIASTNPTTGETLQEFGAIDSREVQENLAKADSAFRSYRNTSFVERATWLTATADLLENDKAHLARTMTVEMGKLLRAAEEEITKCARGCRFYAENAERFLAEQKVETESAHNFIRYEPMGPILAIMPWNFPFWQVFRFGAPALMAGNVALLKHASNVPQCALAIEDVFATAGFPAGAFQTLLVPSSGVDAILDDDRVVAASVTGSEAAGSAVAGRAGSRIKPTVLELGGSDPFIVMPSANLDEAARTAVTARNVNNGQSCIAAKRFIVHAAVDDDFARRFVDGMGGLRVGDPLDPATQLRPLASGAQRDILDAQG